MPVNTNATEVLANWKRGLEASAPKYIASINRVTENPADKAIAQEAVMVQNFTRAVADGKWAAGLRRTTLESWKAAAVNVGAPRLRSGAEKGAVKLGKVLPQLLQAVESAVGQLPARGDRQANKDRMNMFSDLMAEFRPAG